jgi:hypothetical protein
VETVVAIGRRPCGQNCEGFPAGRAPTAANPDPIVLLVVCLFTAPSVTADRLVTAERTPPRQQPQRKCSHPRIGIVFRLRRCDKENQDWREGPPLTVPCQSSDLPDRPSPSGKFSFRRKKNTASCRGPLPSPTTLAGLKRLRTHVIFVNGVSQDGVGAGGMLPRSGHLGNLTGNWRGSCVSRQLDCCQAS